ncbi:hypothetical protein [Pedococcus sp.]|jgi:hypothetical protein|uniref:hypothetical protein n=1 Tax=Pedococcus sp. TaxID=2860345 RepID=UPI002E144127|nr:hypothetical protein [Pedococcus sp.]
MQIPGDDADPDPLHSRLSAFVVEMTRAEMELPHIVYARDARGCMDSFSGPYPTAMEALVAADVEQQIEREADCRHPLTFHIAALYPALGLEAEGR